MINIMSGTTAVTLSSNSAVSKSSKKTSTNASKQNNVINNSKYINNKANGGNIASGIYQNNQQNTINPMQAQVQEANMQSVDYSSQSIEALQKAIRKEHLERNYYIDEATNVPVLQIINNETDRVIGQYPADIYLNLIMRVRENQKLMVDKSDMATKENMPQNIINQQLMANQKS